MLRTGPSLRICKVYLQNVTMSETKLMSEQKEEELYFSYLKNKLILFINLSPSDLKYRFDPLAPNHRTLNEKYNKAVSELQNKKGWRQRLSLKVF